VLRNILGGFGILLVLAVALVAAGCGGYHAPMSQGTPGGTTTMMITASSSGVMHSIPVTLTVN
jgi:ABC-type glycerol-3-phosphate transport system substrate-binding protein